jgi:hypothetical protein
MNHRSSQSSRVDSALKTSFIADSLAMPVHWYYQPLEIERDFIGGIFNYVFAFKTQRWPAIKRNLNFRLFTKR